MRGVATWEPARKLDLFSETGNRMGVTTQIIEKDFWVCWTLDQLFSILQFEGYFLFKVARRSRRSSA